MGGGACLVKCHVKKNLQGGVFVADEGRLLAESCDIKGRGLAANSFTSGRDSYVIRYHLLFHVM